MNEKWWAVLFGAVMLGCGILYAVSPFIGYGLPFNGPAHGPAIDNLYYWILGITGFFFVLTELILVVFMFLYGAGSPIAERRPSVFAPVAKFLGGYFNTPKKIETAWTIVPAAILLGLAFAQVGAWADAKYKSRLNDVVEEGEGVVLHVDVNARQFEWRIRYPSAATYRSWKETFKSSPAKAMEMARHWARNSSYDDIRDVANHLHVIKNHHAYVHLSTKDVIHSFNIPHMRVKQDALPGKIIPVWFKPIASNVKRVGNHWHDGNGRDPETDKPADVKKVWEIACAELCGWGHYRMIGRLFVHDTEEDFIAWLESAAAQQNDYGPTSPKK